MDQWRALVSTVMDLLSSGATELVNGIKRNTFMTFTLLQAEAHLAHPKTKIS
jgi:hypothetical protein